MNTSSMRVKQYLDNPKACIYFYHKGLPFYKAVGFVPTDEEKTIDGIRFTPMKYSEKFGNRDHIVTDKEISCTGCKPENWCRYRVIKCCVDKGISTCAACQDCPCNTMKECFEVTKSFEPKCREVCTEQECQQLKKAFFEKKCRYPQKFHEQY